MKKIIDKYELAEGYSIPTIRMNRILMEFYENLFDENGDPIEHPVDVSGLISNMRQQFNIELDMIKESSYQAYEANYGIDEQEEELL